MEKKKFYFLLGALILTVMGTVLLILTYSGPVEPALRRNEGLIRRDRLLRMSHQAETLLRTRRYAEADKLIRLMRRMEPDNTRAWFLQGRLYYLEQQFDQAGAVFRRLADFLPHQPVILNNLGQALVHAGKLDDGIEQLTRARSLAPDSWQIARNLEAAERRKAAAEKSEEKATAIPGGTPSGGEKEK